MNDSALNSQHYDDMKKTSIAVIGSGISGLSAAWLLGKKYDVTLYEAEQRLGGHSNTVNANVAGKSIAADTGFLVCNDRTYPNLLAMFAHLGVSLVASEMSFSVQIAAEKLAWSGTSLWTLFGDKKNLFRPKFWHMVLDVMRFNRDAEKFLACAHPMTLGEYLMHEGYSEAFKQWYLLPMAAAIWSCPAATVLDFPAATLIRFFKQHGLLQVRNRPQWLTVKNGSRSYVEKMRQRIANIRSGDAVTQITRHDMGVTVVSQSGVRDFDKVVLACHSDQAQALLSDASVAEHDVLSAISYQPNRAILHTDASILPRKKSLWSAWNFHGVQENSLQPDNAAQSVSVSYLISKLQPLPVSEAVIVTLNPNVEIDNRYVLADIAYAHPLLDAKAVAAQARLPEIQGKNRTWYCGAWTAYGFHEDGLKSALHVVNQLGIRPEWQPK